MFCRPQHSMLLKPRISWSCLTQLNLVECNRRHCSCLVSDCLPVVRGVDLLFRPAWKKTCCCQLRGMVSCATRVLTSRQLLCGHKQTV